MSSKSSSNTQVKQNILVATLEIIKTKGMRSVRHRAVAELAGVSLGSTTYHFKSIDDLISSTFIYWHEKNNLNSNPYFSALKEGAQQLINVNIDKKELAQKLLEGGEAYLRNQIFDRQGDRLVELAFNNEAYRNPQLAKVLLNSWSNQIQRLANLFQLVGTVDPISDAEITFSLIMQLEKRALLIQDLKQREVEFDKMRLVLKRQVTLLLELT
jgi:DNA-binding transcriptional regulator YbjK